MGVFDYVPDQATFLQDGRGYYRQDDLCFSRQLAAPLACPSAIQTGM
jgi:hypothetical protein